MREQSGRSLIEIIGVLAISGIMVAGVFSMYQSISNRQKRMIATENLKEIVTKTKTVLEYSGYEMVSVDFLIKSGAFDSFGDRVQVMKTYIESVSDLKKRVTLQNLKMLIDFI